MSQQQQQISLPESKSLLSIIFAVTPLYYLSLQARSRLGLSLDNLHLGLIQVLLLLIFGRLQSWFSERRTSAKPAAAAAATRLARKVDARVDQDDDQQAQSTERDTSTSGTSREAVPRPKSSKSPSVKKLKSHPLFTPTVCDSIVAKFLSATEPDYVSLLPSSASDDITSDRTPLTSWTVLHTTDSLSVMQHPETKKMLYAIQASFPGVPLRKLFEVLTDIKQRPKWDGMAQGSDELERFEVGTKDGREIKGALVWLAMKGVALIKAKDMILVSLAGRLPASADKQVADELQKQQDASLSTSVEKEEKTVADSPDAEKTKEDKDEEKPEGRESQAASNVEGKLRIYCATTSFEHPDHPPRSGFNRMPLGIAGFLIEDDGEGGSKITQITDLSGLGSWVPSAVLRTVTQTMLPKSLTKLGKAASEFDLATSSKFPLEGTDWMPPVLGAQAPESRIMTTTDGNVEEEDQDDDSISSGSSTTLADSEDNLDPMGGKRSDAVALSPSSSRDLHALVSQLRSLTSRLTALEKSQGAGSGAGVGARARGSWYSSLLGGGSGTEQGLMSRSTGAASGLLVTAMGGAAGAAVVLGVLKAWERRRR